MTDPDQTSEEPPVAAEIVAGSEFELLDTLQLEDAIASITGEDFFDAPELGDDVKAGVIALDFLYGQHQDAPTFEELADIENPSEIEGIDFPEDLNIDETLANIDLSTLFESEE